MTRAIKTATEPLIGAIEAVSRRFPPTREEARWLQPVYRR